MFYHSVDWKFVARTLGQLFCVPVMLLTIATKRGSDAWGSGEYGASRGSRRHNGIDYHTVAGTKICSMTEGKVTKLGYPYGDDLSYRYVEITDPGGYRHRYFYVEPTVKMGETVQRTDVIGVAQDIKARYDDNPERSMKNHVHYEIFKMNFGEREYSDPEKWHEMV